MLKPSFAFSGSLSKLKIGVIGTGLRGQWMINLFLDRPDVEISAICDIDGKMIEMTKEIFRKKGRPIPKIYNRDENDYLNLLSNEDLDGVNIATPWR